MELQSVCFMHFQPLHLFVPWRPRAPPPRRNLKASGSFVKSFLRKGQALMGLGLNRDAAKALEEGELHGQTPDLLRRRTC